MKIAEALLLRADMQKKIASLRERIGQNAVVQDGDKAHEDANKLLSEAFGVLNDLESLIFKINQANLSSKLPDGRSLTEAISKRDSLVAQHSMLQHAITKSQKEPDRYSRSEIKWVAIMPVSSLQKQLEDISKKIRELNAAIQETNWKSELEY